MQHNIGIVIDSLQPTMEDYADNAKFNYWLRYAQELDELMYLYQYYPDQVVGHVNMVMKDKVSISAEHHACVDVATTVEQLYPAFAGQFKYQ